MYKPYFEQKVINEKSYLINNLLKKNITESLKQC